MTRLTCPTLALLLLAGCSPDTPRTGFIDQPPDPSDLPFEPLATHPQVGLSNLRFARGETGNERYMVDWKWTKKASTGQMISLVIKPRGRAQKVVPVSTTSQTGGTITGEFVFDGSGKGGKGALETGCEMYLVVGRASNYYKVSNSVTTGGVAATATRPAPSP